MQTSQNEAQPAPKTIPTNTTTPTRTIPYTTNAHTVANGQRLKNVTNPKVNPLFFKDPNDRQAASVAKIQHIMDNPHYQALKPEQKEKLKSRYYDEIVAPVGKSSNYHPPDKNLWMKEIDKRQFGPESFYEDTSERTVNQMSIAAERSVGDILKGTLDAGIWVAKQQAMASLGLTKFFGASGQYQHDLEVSTEKTIETAQKVVNNISHDLQFGHEFWLQTHPTKTFAEKVGSFVGSQIAQLPLYEAVGAARGAVLGEKGVAILTKTLEASPKGQIVAHALGQASDALIAGVMQGKSSQEIKSDMAAFAGFGVIGKTIAGAPMIKKFMAQTMAQGGRPLLKAVTEEAEHELETNKIHGEAAPENVEITPEHVDKALNEAHKQDSIKLKMTTATKVALNSSAMDQFGKPYKELSREQKRLIREHHANLANQALREMPLHVPEIAKANANASVEASAQANPKFAQTARKLAQMGISVSDELQSSEKNLVEKQTGVKNSQGVVKKLVRDIKKSIAKKEMIQQVQQQQQARHYVQYKIENKAYFSNPSPGKKNGFDYKKWLDGMDTHDFLSEIKDHMGNAWWFEKPQHLLEHALTFSKDMPTPFKNRILKELSEMDPGGSQKEWLATAKRRDRHIENLALTGRLSSEGNVFRSSKFKPGTRRTVWQKELEEEANDMLKSMGASRKHYKEAAEQAGDIFKSLSEVMGDPDENVEY